MEKVGGIFEAAAGGVGGGEIGNRKACFEAHPMGSCQKAFNPKATVIALPISKSTESHSLYPFHPVLNGVLTSKQLVFISIGLGLV